MPRKNSRPHASNKRPAFLSVLATGLTVGDAAKKAGVGTRTVYAWRKSDAAFADEWEDAYEQGADALLAEATRRAVQGVEEPVFHLGKIVGHKTNYSDTLIMMLLKSRAPIRYCDRARTAALMRKWAKTDAEDGSKDDSATVAAEALALLERYANAKAATACEAGKVPSQ